ncbi:MAG: hypothetical protein ACYC3S_00445 [Chloroflexota bacterium]
MRPLLVSATVLEEARRFLEDRGAEGLEGTALIGRRGDGIADRLVVPTQRAERGRQGCWVEVPLAGKLELAAALALDETYVARIHSHPGEPFHSMADDTNPVLTQQGALSIVVPYFGLALRRGLDACAVYVLRGATWVALPPGPQRAALVEVK